MFAKLSNYNYNLPKNLIAQQPATPRDSSRLLVLNRKTNKISHHKFFEINKFLKRGDVIVLNNTKVIPARLYAKKQTGGKVEVLLLKPIYPHTRRGGVYLHPKVYLHPNSSVQKWQALTKPGLKLNTKIYFSDVVGRPKERQVQAKIISRQNEKAIIKFNLNQKQFNQFLQKYGHTPLPPYIKQDLNINSNLIRKKIRRRYQTIYAKLNGSVAAPTAGLHFTSRLINKLKKHRIKFEFITLHVGLGTFQPVKENNILKHKIHSEYAEISPQTAKRLNQAKKQGKRIIACGTTVVRALEAATISEYQNIRISPISKQVNIFITPGFEFKTVNAMITNFHLPKSTLLMLISAFSSLKQIKQVYQTAIKNNYRFYSFGDTMLIV